MRWLCVVCLWTSGPVVADDVTRPVSPEGADTGDAFAAVRQGGLRCQGDGYDLPRAAYDQWRDLEITFAPDVAGAD